MKKNTAQKDILYISISSCVLVVMWVGFNIYHAHVTSTIEPNLQLQIQPIEPRFDSQVIADLKRRQTVSPIFELSTASSEAELSPTPTAIETPIQISPTATQIQAPGTTQPSIPPAAPAIEPPGL